MRNEHLFPNDNGFIERLSALSFAPGAASGVRSPGLIRRQTAIGLLLIAALLAFEVFNFDTTRFALANLLGDVNFVGLRWASVLALAFCAIDFAGLAHLFAPSREVEGAGETWYLMGAWLMGATMNAIMTWWAVNLTLLNHSLGNEILSREQLLDVVPPFVAVLVWLTRILFIGAFSVAGDQFFQGEADGEAEARMLVPTAFERGQRPTTSYSRAQERPLRDRAVTTPARLGGAYRPIPRGSLQATRSRRR